jgi:hypothetical protein
VTRIDDAVRARRAAPPHVCRAGHSSRSLTIQHPSEKWALNYTLSALLERNSLMHIGLLRPLNALEAPAPRVFDAECGACGLATFPDGACPSD